MRSFEVARKMLDGEPVKYSTDRCQTDAYEPAYADTQIPVYKTRHSAGADFCCAETVVIPSIWKCIFKYITNGLLSIKEFDKEEAKKMLSPTLVHTGIKASMNDDEVLYLYNRSSNPKKLGLVLANSVGVIDADYYENKLNDGEIMFAFYNFFPFDVTVKAGDTIGQGVFQKFYYPEKGLRINDEERKSGFGSTDN